MPADAREAMRETLRASGMTALVDAFRSAPRTASVQRGIDHLGEAEHWRRIEEKLAQMDPDAFIELGEEMSGFSSLLDRLEAVSCPTTVLVGADDTPFVAPSERLAAAIPGARLVVVPDAAHCPQYENAAVWRAAIATHLAIHE
jgi:pimeloyl-ACP methyl ester carboxylesterase